MHAAAGAFAQQSVQQAVRHAGTAVGGGVSRTGSTAAAVAYAQWGSLLPQQTSATAAAAAAFRRSAGGPAGQHACIPRPGRSLGLQFKWTERTQGLLRSATDPSSLSGLTNLDLGACRVSNEAVFEAVAALTGLRELRMCVYSNADHTVECQLSRLGQLAGLQVCMYA